MIVSNRSVRMALLGLFAFAGGCAGCGEGCDPQGDAGPDGGNATLSFVRPSDGDTLGDADDSSSGLAGLQFDVVVAYSGDEGTTLTLTSNQGESATADVESGEATFENFDLASSVNGIQNVLTVSDGDVDEIINITGVQGDVTGTVCAFITPDNGDILTVDADAQTPGFQFEWSLQCTGEESDQMALEVSAGSGTTVTMTDGTGGASGLVTAGNTNGNNSVVARLFNGADEQVAEARIAVVVTFEAEFTCDATIITPIDNQAFNAMSNDESPDAGFQTSILVDTGDVACSGLDASASVDGNVVTGVVAADGTVSLVVTLDEGTSLITSRVFNDDGDESFDNVTVSVDTEAPTLTITAPVQDSLYGEVDDLDGNKLNGISLPFTGSVTDASSASYNLLCTGTGVSYTQSGDLNVDANGDFDLELTDISKPECALTVTLSDGQNTVVETLTFLVDVPLLCSAVIITPDENAVFAADAVDLSAMPGLQIEVLVDTLNPADCSTFDANVSVGGATFSAAVNAAGIAAVIVTVPEGMSTLTAEVTDGVVVSNVGDNEVSIVVDTILPVVDITSPLAMQLFTSADDIDANPNNGLEIAFTGNVMGQTMASYVLDCTGLGDQSGMIPAGAMNFALVLTGIDQGSCTLTLSATDGINTVMVNRTFSAALDLPCQAEITTPVDGAQIGASAPDAAPGTPGFQTIIVVETSNPEFCEGLTVEVDVDGTVFTGTVSNLGQAFVVVTLPDGNATVSAIITDGVRVSDVGDNTIDITVDRTAPTLVVTSPELNRVYGDVDDVDGNPANGTTLTLTGNITGATMGTYALTCTGNGGPYNLSGDLNPDGTGAFSVALVDIDDPNCSLVVDVTDGINSITRTITFNVADVAISMALLGDDDDNGAWITSEDDEPLTTTTMEIPVNLTAAFTVGSYTGRVEIRNPVNNMLITTYTLPAMTSGLASSATISLPVSDEMDYEAHGYVTNGSGVDTGPIIIPFIIDTQPPQLDPVLPQLGIVLNAADDREVAPGFQTFAFVSASGLVDGTPINIQFAGPTTVSVSCTYSSITEGCGTDSFTLADGSYTGTATSTDEAGNTATISMFPFSVDATAPNVTAFTVVDDTVPVGTLTLAESGDPSGMAVSDIVVTLDPAASLSDGTSVSLRIGGAVVATAMASGDSVTFSAVSLPQGTLNLSLSGPDAAGNPLTGVITRTLIVDTIAPTLSIGAPTANPLLVANDKDSVTLPGLQIDFAINTDAQDGRIVELFDGATSLGTAAVSGGSVVFADLTISDGAHNFTAVVSDAAGNATTSAVYAPTVDATPPVLTITSPADATLFMAADDANAGAAGFQVDVTVSHTGLEPGQTVTVINAANATLGSAPATGGSTTVQITVPNVDGETTALRARATEVIGNIGTSAVVNIQVQTGAYSVVLDAPAQVAGMVQIGNANDMGGGSVAIIATVTNWSAAPLPKTASLRINGMVASTTPVVAGDTLTFTHSFTDGQTGDIEIQVLDGAAKAGTSGVINFDVDFGDPTVNIASVVSGTGTVMNPTSEVFNMARDLSAGTAGLQVTLTIDVTGCEDGEVTVREAATAIAAPVAVNASGTQTLTLNVTDTSENTADWDARCTDLSSNTATDAMATVVDITAPATPSLVATIVGNPRLGQVQITYTAPGDDANTGASAVLATVASREPITAANFDALATGPTTPGIGGLIASSTTATPGSLRTDTATFLAYENTWNFGVRALDDVGNASYGFTSPTNPLGLYSSAWTFIDQETDSAPGNTYDDFFGFGSTNSGDFNGDGYMDLAIAAKQEGTDCITTPVESCEGSIRVIAGGPSIASLNTGIATKRLTDTTFNTEQFLFRGDNSLTIMDINGDGLDDLLTMAVENGPYNKELHVYRGTTDLQGGGEPELVRTDVEPIVIDFGFEYNRYALTNIGDVNGDGIDDLGVNSHESGTSHFGFTIVFGRTNLATTAPTEVVIEDDVSMVDLMAGTTDQRIGAAVALGDLEGDGFDDFAVDTPNGVYIVRGRASASWPTLPTVLNISTVAAADTIACSQFWCGFSKGAGDVDGDGLTDLVFTQDNVVDVHLNTGTGFASVRDYHITPSGGDSIFNGYQASVIVGDTNGDSLSEIVLLVQDTTPRAELFFGGDYSEGAGLTTGVRDEAEVIYNVNFNGTKQAFISICGNIDNDATGLDELCIGSEEDDAFTVRY